MPSVLHVLPYANLNGTERHVLLQALYARDKGWQVKVALPPGPMREELQEQGIPVVELPTIGLGSFLAAIATLRAESSKVSLVHVHAAMELALGLRWAGCRNIVFTAHCYHTPIDYAKAGLFLNPSCQATISVSATERDRLLRWGLDPRRHHTIPNGIELERYGRRPSSLRKELRVPDDVLLIGTVGRLSTMKRVDVLIRAIGQTEVHHLAIAGDGAERTRLERFARRLGVGSRIHWLGRISDVSWVYSGLDLFATASEREGLSLACLEAMAAGLPVMAAGIPEFREVVEPGFGRLFPVGNWSALAREIEQLATDRDGLAAMGREALRRVRDYSAEAMGARTLGLYESLLSAQSPLAAPSPAP